MNKPHKHCEVIKAWADGKPIQYYNVFSSNWLDASNPISWDEGNRYRIKPEPEKVWVRLYENLRTKASYSTNPCPIKWTEEQSSKYLSSTQRWISDWFEIQLYDEE